MATLRDAFKRSGIDWDGSEQQKARFLVERGLVQESAKVRPIPQVKVVLGVVKRASGLSVVEVEYWSKRRH